MENKKPSNPDLHKGSIQIMEDRVTLRDYFANSAMQGICAHPTGFGIATADGVAKRSYEIADAMLKQREL